MSPHLHLLIHNIVGIISAIAFIGAGFFTFLNNPKRIANVTFALTTLMAAVFAISHVIGVNIADPEVSRLVLMFNICIFFIAAFQLHAIFDLIGKAQERKIWMYIIYAGAIGCTIMFLVKPDLFLLASQSKMYFTNYYVPGSLNWIRVAFLYGLVIPWGLCELIAAFHRTQDIRERNQYKYFILALIAGYAIGFIPNFLVYNIQIDPLWGMAFGILFAVPFAYSTVKYEMFSVRVIAKQAFFYSLAVVMIGGVIILLNYANSLIVNSYPGFPGWSIALISSLVLVSLSVVIWRHLKEGDILKYEFITTVTHKFRTPLTHIKWASENISQTVTSEDIQTQLGYIQNANTKLVELTNLLVNVSETENSAYQYHIEKTDLSAIGEEILGILDTQISSQGIHVIRELPTGMIASIDPGRIKFIVQTFIENAIHYSQKDGTITVSALRQGPEIIFSVKDGGIGMSNEDMPRLFSKFYRGKQARMADTEGMGIGLFISKKIIERHNGRIWAESEGIGKGSRFAFAVKAE